MELRHGANRDLLRSCRVRPATEQERGWRYRNYVESAAALGFVVGTHWFDYVGPGGSGDDISRAAAASITTRGCVNVADRPYKTFLDGVMQTNKGVYDVLLGKKKPFYHDFGEVREAAKGGHRKIEHSVYVRCRYRSTAK